MTAKARSGPSCWDAPRRHRHRRAYDAAALVSIWTSCGCRCGTRSTSPRWAPHRHRSRDTDGFPRRPQHHAERAVPPASGLFVIVATRSVNSLIWALLLVAILGPGCWRGSSPSRSLHRLHRQAALRGDRGNRRDQVEAIAATGASRGRCSSYGIVPQIMPAFAGITTFRWDINIRESTVLGLVGAGGIG
jgi:hypothetical protein